MDLADDQPVDVGDVGQEIGAHLAGDPAERLKVPDARVGGPAREDLFADFYAIWPERFGNNTNGVTPRRWIAVANPALAAYRSHLAWTRSHLLGSTDLHLWLVRPKDAARAVGFTQLKINEARAVSLGHYIAPAAPLTAPGDWKLRVVDRMPGTPEHAATVDLAIS